jgi:transposase-like protein
MSPKVTKRTRRLFTPEFKAEAVRLVRESGKTVAKVARELDLTATCLRAWVNQAAVDEKGSGRARDAGDAAALLPRRDGREAGGDRRGASAAGQCQGSPATCDRTRWCELGCEPRGVRGGDGVLSIERDTRFELATFSLGS